MIKKNKTIWFVSDSEPIPQLTGTGRLMRAGKLAEYASKEDCRVVWWTTTWLHYENRFFSNKDEIIQLNDNLEVRMLHVGKAYKKHVSIDRILYCRNIAKAFKKTISKESPPDLIHCSWPLIELGYESVKYGNDNHIPVIIDIRDFWPDIFTLHYNGLLKKFAQLAVKLLYGRQTKYSFKYAHQIIGVTEDAVEMSYRWGRKQNKLDHPMYLSYQERVYDLTDINMAESYWNSVGINKDDFLIIYIGSIHLRNAQLKLLIDAARNIKDDKVKFVLCGKGPDLEKLTNETCDMDNIIFPGYKNDVELYVLGKLASVGILPYSNTPDFINALPNKLGEYLYYKLAVFTTLKGESRYLLEKNACGAYFEDSDGLVELINQYKDDSKLMCDVREKSEILYQEFFNADKVYTQYCHELIQMCKGDC